MNLGKLKLTKLKNWLTQRQKIVGLPGSLLSTELTKQDMDGESLEAPILSDLEPLDIVQSIKKLPLKDFIECCVNDNYELLIKGDKRALTPSDAIDLANRWATLILEFYDVSGDEKAIGFFKLTARRTAIMLRQKVISIAIETLKLYYVEAVAVELRNFYKYPFTAETMDIDLKKVSSREIPFQIELDKINAEIEAIQKEQGIDAQKKSSEDGFYQTLLTYEQVAKVPVMDKENMSTYMYALYVKNLNKQLEYLNKQ